MTSPVALLLDPQRLMVAGSLAGVARTTEQVVDHTGLSAKDVLAAVGDLRAAGLVETNGPGYLLPMDVLRQIASAERTRPTPMDRSIGYGMTDREQRVLARFFEGHTLTEIPTARANRLVVLERLCLEFAIGQHYTEQDVNRTLASFHPDTATLRRYLVDEDLLDRNATHYWRSGGRVDDEPAANA